jgi:hypothetical protein
MTNDMTLFGKTLRIMNHVDNVKFVPASDDSEDATWRFTIDEQEFNLSGDSKFCVLAISGIDPAIGDDFELVTGSGKKVFNYLKSLTAAHHDALRNRTTE